MTEQIQGDVAVNDSPNRSTPGIVVGVDGSDGAQHALRWAVELDDWFGSIQPIMTWRYSWWGHTAPTALLGPSLQPLAERDVEANLAAVPHHEILEPIICRAQAGPALVEYGANAKLIVVGTRGRSGLKDGLLGSVSAYVAAHATVPVAVVPGCALIEERYGRVVVGIDGSVGSLRALTWAVRNAPKGADIEVVHTWGNTSNNGAEPGFAPAVYKYYEERGARFVLNQAIRAVTRAVGTRQHRIIPCLEPGDARSVLKEKAEGADMLVLGARGVVGLSRIVLGSVTTALVRQPTLATIVVPSLEQ